MTATIGDLLLWLDTTTWIISVQCNFLVGCISILEIHSSTGQKKYSQKHADTSRDNCLHLVPRGPVLIRTAVSGLSQSCTTSAPLQLSYTLLQSHMCGRNPRADHRYQKTSHTILETGQTLIISHTQFVNNTVKPWFRNTRPRCLKRIQRMLP